LKISSAHLFSWSGDEIKSDRSLEPRGAAVKDDNKIAHSERNPKRCDALPRCLRRRLTVRLRKQSVKAKTAGHRKQSKPDRIQRCELPDRVIKRSVSDSIEETALRHGHCSEGRGSLRRLMKVLSCWAAAPSAGKMARVARRAAIFHTAQGLTASTVDGSHELLAH
jgi:hypothetical protein